MRTFLRKLGWLTQRERREADLRAALEFHLAEEAESREAEGTSLIDARFAARRELGNLTRVAAPMLALAAGLAGYIPVYGAAQIHPTEALRRE
jgi:hypothetical protein